MYLGITPKFNSQFAIPQKSSKSSNRQANPLGFGISAGELNPSGRFIQTFLDGHKEGIFALLLRVKNTPVHTVEEIMTHFDNNGGSTALASFQAEFAKAFNTGTEVENNELSSLVVQVNKVIKEDTTLIPQFENLKNRYPNTDLVLKTLCLD